MWSIALSPVRADPIAVRIYTPKGAGPFPVVVYYHGGGWVIADLDTYDASPRALANLANAVVVSSHYRQGPEHKFPAAHQDAFAAYRWVLANARSLKGDPSKVAVAGESAGGGLAAAVSMMARDSGAQMPVHQLLVYPIAGYDLNTPSYQENADAKPLNKAMMAWFFEKYLRSPGGWTESAHRSGARRPQGSSGRHGDYGPDRSASLGGQGTGRRARGRRGRGGLPELRGLGPRVLRHGSRGGRRQGGPGAGGRWAAEGFRQLRRSSRGLVQTGNLEHLPAAVAGITIHDGPRSWHMPTKSPKARES